MKKTPDEIKKGLEHCSTKKALHKLPDVGRMQKSIKFEAVMG